MDMAYHGLSLLRCSHIESVQNTLSEVQITAALASLFRAYLVDKATNRKLTPLSQAPSRFLPNHTWVAEKFV